LVKEIFYNKANNELNLPARLDSISLLEKFVTEIFQSFKLSNKLFGKAMVSLTEALNNAILHGNKSNPDSWIKLLYFDSPFEAKFVVIDEGDGFDYKNIPDPTAPENILKETGRGVFLMKSLADKIEFLENGSVVLIQFNK
jgi:serine/threonine-protein kinase RsbW